MGKSTSPLSGRPGGDPASRLSTVGRRPVGGPNPGSAGWRGRKMFRSEEERRVERLGRQPGPQQEPEPQPHPEPEPHPRPISAPAPVAANPEPPAPSLLQFRRFTS